MKINSTHQPATSTKGLFIALLIFGGINIVVFFLVWFFNPLPLEFSENFENNERNKQYLPCAAFTIVQERLRVTVDQSHSGCAVRLPNEYENFEFTVSVYPVQDVKDGSINILFRQNTNGWYEIQFRPKVQQFNFIELANNTAGETYIKFTTGWKQAPNAILNNSENKIKLTATQHWIDFWFNDAPIFKDTTIDDFTLQRGGISIGAGAGDTGGIAFEFDNLEIRKEILFSRWWYDFIAIEELKKSGH